MHRVAMQSSAASLPAASSRQAVRCGAPQAQVAEPRLVAQPTSRRSLLALVPLVASATLVVGDASAGEHLLGQSMPCEKLHWPHEEPLAVFHVLACPCMPLR